MTINSNNYEEFFLLYVDNELDAAQRAEVEAFAAAHPDLQGELNALLQTRLSSAESLSFDGKALLYRQETPGLITADNYETFFLLYADNELSPEERAAVERFAEEHPGKKQEWVLLQHAKLPADDLIICPDKESLYHIGKKYPRIVPIRWIRVAAAAAVIITGGLLWMNGNKTEWTDGAHQEIASASKGKNIFPDEATPNPGSVSSPEKTAVAENRQETSYGNDNAGQKDIVKTTAKRSLQVVVKTAAVDVQPIPRESLAVIDRNTLQQPALYENALPPQEDIKKKEPAPVKPVILDAAAFNGDRDVAVAGETDDMHYLNITDDDKRSKGKFRGLFRKASRLINRATNAGTEEEKSIVRVASFEIVKK